MSSREYVKTAVVAFGCMLAWVAELLILAPILCALLFLDHSTNRNKQ